MLEPVGFPEEITQANLLKDFLDYDQRGWTIVYCSRHHEEDFAIFAALAPRSLKHSILSQAEWEINAYCGQPGFIEDQGGRYTYARFGRRDGLIPLVIRQDHSGVLPTMLPQILDEFLLFHNLWVEPSGIGHKKLMLDGSDEVACEVTPQSVRIRSKYLLQFQAARQLYLVRYLDSIIHTQNQWSATSLATLDHTYSSSDHIVRRDVRTGLLGVNDVSSRLLGKHIVKPPSQTECGVWPWEQDPEAHLEHQRFVVGETEMGEHIEHTCDPDTLRENMGFSDVLSLGQFTPVCFRKEVMDLYYADTQKYQVSDGSVSCGGCWSLHLDNNHPDYITVFLYRLGEDLPKQEQLHWRYHNIVQPEQHLSETAYRRSILGEWAEPDSPEWRFKHSYERFREKSRDRLGWDLLLDAEEGGTSLMDRVRVPLQSSEREFGEQGQLLHKILVEALNVQQLKQEVEPDINGSLNLLRAWQSRASYPYTDRDIEILETIRTIRNKTSHIHGTSYEKALRKHSIPDDRRDAIAGLLFRIEAMFGDWSALLV